MLFRNQQQKFLFCLNLQPRRNACCGCLTLQQGTIFIFFMDFITGIISCFNLFQLQLIDDEDLENQKPTNVNLSTYKLFLVVSNLINIIVLPFAVNGYQGAVGNDATKLQSYSKYKQIEFFALVVWNIVSFFFIPNKAGDFQNVNQENYQNVIIFSCLISFILVTFWRYYWTQIVWSAQKRLEDGQNINTTSPDIVQFSPVSPNIQYGVVFQAGSSLNSQLQSQNNQRNDQRVQSDIEMQKTNLRQIRQEEINSSTD